MLATERELIDDDPDRPVLEQLIARSIAAIKAARYPVSQSTL